MKLWHYRTWAETHESPVVRRYVATLCDALETLLPLLAREGRLAQVDETARVLRALFEADPPRVWIVTLHHETDARVLRVVLTEEAARAEAVDFRAKARDGGVPDLGLRAPALVWLQGEDTGPIDRSDFDVCLYWDEHLILTEKRT